MSSIATSVSPLAGTAINMTCGGTTPCPTPAVCPACGGLECLCRPRFFAGQLLTEEDLNRLDHYVVAKNRLHNRYLVGTGVSCGLEVTCNICGPGQASTKVMVSPGYAVSPCGNDIIVCQAASVDICQLIQSCQPATNSNCFQVSPQLNQAPPSLTNRDGTLDECSGTTDWILAVCYQEQPCRPIGALVGVNTPDCGCTGSCCGNCGGSGSGAGGCGNSGGCGCSNANTGAANLGGRCGCGSSGASAPMGSATSQSPGASYATRTAGGSKAISCEPTLTCEGYSFVAYKPPTPVRGTGYGAAATRVLCCLLQLLQELYAARSTQLQSASQAYSYLASIQQLLMEVIQSQGFYDCQLLSQLGAVVIPSPNQQLQGVDLATAYTNSLVSLAEIGEALVRKCVCSAILPPCPSPSATDCVPLATITVSNNNCRVLSICNIAARKFLVTLPNIAYWLSFLSTTTNGVSPLTKALEGICCPQPNAIRTKIDFASNMAYVAPQAAAPATSPGAAAAQPAAEQPGAGQPTAAGAPPAAAPPASTIGVQGGTDITKTLATQMLSAAIGKPERQVDGRTLFLGALGLNTSAGIPLTSDTELSHPAEFLVANQVLQPALQQLLPNGLLAALATQAAAQTGSGDLSTLKQQLQALQTQVSSQQTLIEQLRKG